MTQSAGGAPSPTFAIIAGGGTGGHAVPAIAIGRALVAAGHPADSIHFLGSRRGIEGRIVPDAGFEITLLPGRGIARRLTLDNVGAVAGLVAGIVQAVRLVRRRRPAVVVGGGGYASVAGALAAVLWRIPLVVAEQNAVPGLANRLAGRFAAVCAVSWPGTPLPRPVLTGNPVRPEILGIDRSAAGRVVARRHLGIPDGVSVVAVAGGSLGAGTINRAVAGLIRVWSERSGLVIRHVAGERDYDELAAATPDPVPGGLRYQLVRFEDRMDLLLTAADVAVLRAGASTVAELTVAAVPAILVPLPGAPGDHQTLNARRLAVAGAAVIVPDDELTPARLAAELDRLLGDPGRLKTMGEAARALGHPEAAAAVATLIENHARG